MDQCKQKTMDKIDKDQFEGFNNLSLISELTSAKVYVSKDGNSNEWSFSAPAHVMTPENSLLRGAYSASNMITLFNVMPEIFAPINEIAKRVSSLKFVLKRFEDDEIVWDNENFNKLMNRPNPLMDFRQLIWQFVAYKYLTGASFQYINKPSLASAGFESIKTMTNIPSDKVKITPDELADPYTATELKDYIKKISIKRPNGTDRDFDLNNIMLVLNPDLSNGNKVDKFRSLLSGGEAALLNLVAVYIARRQIYIKRGALGFVVSAKTDASGTVALTKNEKRDMQADFQKEYGLVGQDSIFPIASAPVDFVKTSASIQELQPFEETETDARALYAVVRVPKHLCPTKNNSTFNNVDSETKTFYTDVIIPEGEHICELYTTMFNIPGHYVAIDASGVEVLQKNKKDEAETNRTNGEVYEQRFKNGICTLNDWIIAAGGEASDVAFYNKRLYEMNDQEKSLINLNTKTSTNEVKTIE